MRTPWGNSDYEEDYGNGIKFYGTPSHGGFKIPKELNNLIPEYMRNEYGWYEEDCEWAIPVITLAYYFDTNFFVKNYKNALDIFRNYFWREYEEYFGIELREGESYSKDEHIWREKHKNSLVVVSAVIDNEKSKEYGRKMVLCHAVRGGRDHTGRYMSDEKYIFLIPEEEYNKRGRFPFVIEDPSKYILLKKGW